MKSTSSICYAGQILILLYFSPQLRLSRTCLAAPVKSNHRITFQGLRHGFRDDQEAKDSLAESLRNITGYQNVTVESLNSEGATWYVDDISDSIECPREQIESILNSIRDQETNDFTRTYKLSMTEDFGKPRGVAIDWLGPCQNMDRKRSQVLGEKPAADGDNVTTTGSINPLEEITTALIGDTPEPTEATTEPGIETTSTPLPPTEPPTNTDTESTTIFSLATTGGFDLDGSNSSSDSNVTDGLSVVPPLTNFETFSDPFFTNTKASDPPTTTPSVTTVASVSSSPTTTASTIAPQTSMKTSPAQEAPTTEMPMSTTTTAPVTTTTPTTTDDSAPTTSDAAEITTTVAPQAVDETTDPAGKLLAPPPPPPPSDVLGASEELAGSNPHIGKYVGLGGGFLIVLAYLVCSRAYRRQGMYELHDNE